MIWIFGGEVSTSCNALILIGICRDDGLVYIKYAMS